MIHCRMLFTLVPLLALASAGQAQTVDPYYAGSYSLASLGTPTGVPGPFGGLTLKANDSNTLLIGGAANGGAGIISQIGVVRSNVGGLQRITGFNGTATQFATAPNIDGGLTYAPNGSLLFTAYPINQIGELKPGSAVPDRMTALSGISASVGSLLFSPSGRLKVLSYNASIWYDVPFALDGSGLYTFGSPTSAVQLSGGLEGAVFVPGGSALFPSPSVLVAEFGNGRISSYEVDAIGDPIPTTRRTFIDGLSGAEGSFIDPTTGDFLFSTFGGGNQVISVRGFTAVPEPASLAVLGIGALALLRRRRR